MRLRDTRANQPSATGLEGVLYCVTDEGNIIERSNGSAWQAYSPSPNVGGGLILVENKIIAANTQTVTFSGLDGDTDGSYLLLGKIKNGAASDDEVQVRPNGVTTNLTQVWANFDGSSLAVNTESNWDWIYLAANSVASGRMLISAQKVVHSVAKERRMQSTSYTDIGGVKRCYERTGLWNETSTNLTSLDIVSDIANGIGDGSVIGLYKFKQS